MNRAPVQRLQRGDRVIVIANPATKGDIRSVESYLRARVPAGVKLEIYHTTADGDVAGAVRSLREGAAMVIAAGGDGTVSSVAAGLDGSDVLLGIVPAGSTNIIARELGIPSQIGRSIDLVFGSFSTRSLDVGLCNEKVFLHMAGAGIDSHLFSMADPALKRKIGWLAYIPAAIKALGEPGARYTISMDGDEESVEATLVLVANGSSIIAPTIRIDSSIRSNDGMLDVLVLTASRPHELASVFARFATGHVIDSPFVLQRRVRHVTIASNKPMPVQLDGDVAESTPVSIDVRPKGVTMIVPPGFA